MNQTFRTLSASLVGALMVAALGLITNLVDSDKMAFFLLGIVVFAAAVGAVAYALNFTLANHAEQALRKLQDDCATTLSHVRNEYTSSITRGAIIHDTELDVLERSDDTKEVWVVTPLDLNHDVPGKVFFTSLKDNLDRQKKRYTYLIKDSPRARQNAREIAEGIDEKRLMTFVLLSDAEWNSLPIVGIPVTIHNPEAAKALKIYVSTQQHNDRGQYWAVFSGWTTTSIIDQTRKTLKTAKRRMTLEEYAQI